VRSPGAGAGVMAPRTLRAALSPPARGLSARKNWPPCLAWRTDDSEPGCTCDGKGCYCPVRDNRSVGAFPARDLTSNHGPRVCGQDPRVPARLVPLLEGANEPDPPDRGC
jgi:hypothetical protein